MGNKVAMVEIRGSERVPESEVQWIMQKLNGLLLRNPTALYEVYKCCKDYFKASSETLGDVDARALLDRKGNPRSSTITAVVQAAVVDQGGHLRLINPRRRPLDEDEQKRMNKPYGFFDRRL